MTTDQLKKELEEYVEARKRATHGDHEQCLHHLRWVHRKGICRGDEYSMMATIDDAKFFALAANQSAKHAEMLLVAIEALEKANTALKWGRSPNEDDHLRYVNNADKLITEALAKIQSIGSGE